MTETDNVSGIRSSEGQASSAQEAAASIDPLVLAAKRARDEGRNEDALRHVQAAFARMVADDGRRDGSEFGTMMAWEVLAREYLPARAALEQARDAQVAHVLAGSFTYGLPHNPYLGPRTRFSLIVRINEILGDAGATHALFVQLDARYPEQARREAWPALPAVVQAGDFHLAERYLRNPIHSVADLNETALGWPMFPPYGTAPRLAATLSNFARELGLTAATLRGLGRGKEAETLLADALGGLANEEMRTWAQRELDTPGAIIAALTAHQMALGEGR